jgi:hypothetical protein
MLCWLCFAQIRRTHVGVTEPYGDFSLMFESLSLIGLTQAVTLNDSDDQNRQSRGMRAWMASSPVDSNSNHYAGSNASWLG